MKQTKQILLFLLSLLPIFAMGNEVVSTTQLGYFHPIIESLIIEEETEVSLMSPTVQEDGIEISGGNPDNLSVSMSAIPVELKTVILPSAKNICSKKSAYIYGRKVPLYLQYLSLKLHC
ncbi:hypothetical protein [Tenacibaculum aquimarinum]|uniref:hypothetical protein n=1 Tax=Tenacibaculum aquimarinum TaxID=2910675 RepID=UPI001F0A5C60|nr:hypothetical protein [Tenacibaculum aquimarinum]MCH3884500.1 hypothetical protein [Tenacibaculum aquimarinum]